MADNTKDSFAFEAPSSTSIPHPPPPKTNLSFMASQYILRILAILLSASSIAVMVTNNQTVTIFSFQFQAHYYYSSSLKFLVSTNAIICAFSVLSLIAAFLLLRRRAPPSSQSQPRCIFFILFLHDLVMTVVMISGCAAATAIGYVGKYGEKHVGWIAICDRVPKFCKTNTVSICLSYLAFFVYLALTILMAYKLMMSSSPPNK